MTSEHDPPPSEPQPSEAPPAAAPAAQTQARGRAILRGLNMFASFVVGSLLLSLVWAGAYRFIDPPGTFVMLGRALSGQEIHRDWTPIGTISPHLIRAVIAAEDSNFCRHRGFDFEAIEDAVEHNKNGRRRRGASTITQQTAKNAFLWNGGGWVRKGAEAWFAGLIDTLWTKRRVMEVYLNVAEWGDGLFGAEAAARARFSKSAKDLTKQEAALLAAVLPSPNKWRVDPPGPYVRRRAATLRKRMDIVARDGLDACVR